MTYDQFLETDVSDPDYQAGEWHTVKSGCKVWVYNFKWWFIQQHLDSGHYCHCWDNFGQTCS